MWCYLHLLPKKFYRILVNILYTLTNKFYYCLFPGYLSKLQGQLRYKIAVRTDHRVKIMSEITSGIQVIKMYAWEKPFEKVVALARK